MIRLFVTHDLEPGARLGLDEAQSRYLMAVMRLDIGAVVEVFNGRDGAWQAEIAETGKKRCVLAVTTCQHPQPEPSSLELVMALVKRAPLELVIEKATELGVGAIQLVTTRRTNADHTNLARLGAIATEAAEQCERLDVPDIKAPQKLERLLETWPDGRVLVYCDEAGDDPDALWGGTKGRAGSLADRVRDLGDSPVSLLIGPEGGFDPQERALLRNLSFVRPVTLGPRILRADTAAIAALSVLQAINGDWNCDRRA